MTLSGGFAQEADVAKWLDAQAPTPVQPTNHPVVCSSVRSKQNLDRGRASNNRRLRNSDHLARHRAIANAMCPASRVASTTRPLGVSEFAVRIVVFQRRETTHLHIASDLVPVRAHAATVRRCPIRERTNV